ncbi:MAG: hypothetical protein MUF72_05080 [Elainella sp. Prado103]|nr:hypothetical protein [Elainella sp. Prado103]
MTGYFDDSGSTNSDRLCHPVADVVCQSNHVVVALPLDQLWALSSVWQSRTLLAHGQARSFPNQKSAKLLRRSISSLGYNQ